MIKVILALSIAATLSAFAQAAPIPVFFRYDQAGTNRWSVDRAMHQALSQPQFLQAAQRDARVLEITIDGKVAWDKGDNAKGFTFTLNYWRGGDKLGDSVEYCRTDEMQDCADQLVLDITSADAIRH